MLNRRPKILFVACTTLEERPSMGVDQRMRILYDGLTDIGEVDFYQADTPESSTKQRGISIGSLRDIATKTAVLHPNLRRRRVATSTALRFREIQPEVYDVVFLHRFGACWWTVWTDPKRTILDIDDIPSKIYYDRMRYGNPLFRVPRWFIYHWARWCEQRNLNAFRYSIVCSEEDRKYLRHDRVVVIPNAFWLPPDSDMPEYVKGNKNMLFVGSLGWPPNADGLGWFVENVLPLIRNKIPNATITVVGRTPTRNFSRLAWRNKPGVEFIGTVNEVAPYIRDTKIEICPVLRGQGTRIKILESLAYAKPVVSTSVGAYGIDIGEREGIFRGDDPAIFADNCIRLLSDEKLRVKSGMMGRHFVLANASPEAIKRRLAVLVETILSSQNAVSNK